MWSYTIQASYWTISIQRYRYYNIAKTETDLNKKIIKGEFSVPTTVSVSSSLKRLLKSILNPQVDKRPLAKQLMSDPWLCSEGELDKEQTYLE